MRTTITESTKLRCSRAAREARHLPSENRDVSGVDGRIVQPPENCVRLTAQRLTRAARAYVPKPTRRTACTHVSRAMQAARRRRVLILTRRLGRRTEAGPRRVLPRVRPLATFQ